MRYLNRNNITILSANHKYFKQKFLIAFFNLKIYICE